MINSVVEVGFKFKRENPDMGKVITRSFRCLILTSLMLLSASNSGATISPQSRDILDRARAFGLGDEAATADAKAVLQKVAPARLLAALKQGLETGGEWTMVASRAGVALRVHALLPDLENAFEKNDDWILITSMSELADSVERVSLAKRLVQHLDRASAPSKVAIIEALGRWDLPLSDDAFAKTSQDENFEVRQAAVRQFFKTRARLSNEQQAARFENSFALKPYQVRLEAMIEFAALTKSEQTKLKSAVGSKFKSDCKAEKQTAVKVQCEKVLALEAGAK